VTGRATRRYGVLVAGLMLALAAGPLAAAPLTETGRRAYEAAQKADDEAAAAFEEGEKTLALLKGLAPERDAVPPGLKPFLDEAEAARQALTGYRRLTQASATDALRLLADVSKMPMVPAPDLVRRDTLEQHAVLAAHEAAVMSARTRTETERLRAILAEARLASVEAGGGPGRAARGAPAGGGAGEAPPSTTRRGDTVVPNLIGARLDAAVRDLEAAGLRVGPITGPRDGFIVKQSPDAGAGVPRQSAVTVTLSGTAATITPTPTTP
jgi:PASTA domain-containing protein